jgi:transcription-repair coupling factor (superfamily II helicase)
MGLFDPATQRRTEALGSCRILPAAETLPTLCEGGRLELAKKIEEYAEKCGRKKNSPQAAALSKTLREDADKLRGGAHISDADRYLPLIYPFACALDYFPQDAFVVLCEPGRTADRAKEYIRQTNEDIRELNRRGVVAASPESFYKGWEDCARALADFPLYMADAFTVGRYPVEPRTMLSIQAKQLPGYAGSSQTAADDVRLYLRDNYKVVVLAGDLRRAGVLRGFFEGHGIQADIAEKLEKMPEQGKCVITVGSISAGMEFPLLRTAILTDSQLVRVKDGQPARKKKLPENQKRLASYTDLEVGDLVVHEHHGIGRFSGIVKMTVDGFEKDYMKISYAGTDCLYVPCTQLDHGGEIHRRGRRG